MYLHHFTHLGICGICERGSKHQHINMMIMIMLGEEKSETLLTYAREFLLGVINSRIALLS